VASERLAVLARLRVPDPDAAITRGRHDKLFVKLDHVDGCPVACQCVLSAVDVGLLRWVRGWSNQAGNETRKEREERAERGGHRGGKRTRER
jgi:hypothetical protein